MSSNSTTTGDRRTATSPALLNPSNIFQCVRDGARPVRVQLSTFGTGSPHRLTPNVTPGSSRLSYL
ncbi:unnamed protein product, partial [Nesidiocoris tenuis]